jgi:outer membrane protein assembly factor BamB
MGISEDTGLPLVWSDKTNILWKVKLPGPGASSPITFGDRIYLTAYSGYGLSKENPGDIANLQRHLICLDRRDGKILLDAKAPNVTREHPYTSFIDLHGYASSTPAADATGIYVFYGASGARGYGQRGQLVWERSCGHRNENFGSASSPLLYQNLVIINASVESGAIIALDKSTGREVWRTPTEANARSTPLLVDLPGEPELIVHLKGRLQNGSGAGVLGALNARTGAKLWESRALDSYLNPSPIFHNGVVYAIASYPGWAVAIKPGGRGDVTATHKLWEIKHGSEMCTPIYFEGHLYWAHEEKGMASCVDAKTGAVVYQERLRPTPGRIYASGVLADGRIYYVSRENGTYVVAAKPRFEFLAHNVIESDKSVFNGTPAIVNGQLLMRSDTYLYCLGMRK